MDKLTMRLLKHKFTAKMLSDNLPLELTDFGEVIAVLVSPQEYRRLIERHSAPEAHTESHTDATHESQDAKTVILPMYNPAIHQPGDHVLMRQGNRLVISIVPELDVDRRPVPSFT